MDNIAANGYWSIISPKTPMSPRVSRDPKSALPYVLYDVVSNLRRRKNCDHILEFHKRTLGNVNVDRHRNRSSAYVFRQYGYTCGLSMNLAE